MLSPLGTLGTYFETGSSRLSLPSWASSTITAAVIDLVLEAILKWVSARGGLIVPSRVVPWVTVNSPWGVRRSTTAPGTPRSEEHTSELQSRLHLVCRLLLEKKKKISTSRYSIESESERCYVVLTRHMPD